jgi:hypothetical protein
LDFWRSWSPVIFLLLEIAVSPLDDPSAVVVKKHPLLDVKAWEAKGDRHVP